MIAETGMVETIFPKTSGSTDFSKGPIFYFNVPIIGKNDLQYEAVLETQKQFNKFFYAVLPMMYGDNAHPLMLCRASSTGLDDKFENKIQWERYYLHLASTTGCIIFWLQNGVNEHYAMNIHEQLGECRGRMIHKRDIKIVVGAEKNFHGLSHVQENFNVALGFEPPYKFPIYETLASTIKAAIKKVR